MGGSWSSSPVKRPKRGLYILARDRNRFFFQNLTRCVLRVCDGAEPETRDVFLFGGLKKFDSARGSADENRENHPSPIGSSVPPCPTRFS